MYKAKVAVLGPEGSFSEKVVQKNFVMDNVELTYADSFGEIFGLLDDGKVDVGVIPTEDSIDGDVPESLNLLRRHDAYTIVELYLEVKCALLGKEDISRLKKIHSHYKLLNVCQRYLDVMFPDLPRREVRSTSEAARLASTNPTIGALADEETARRYGLKVLSREPHDYGHHTTRFLVLAKQPLNCNPDEETRKSATRLTGHVYFIKE